jgi:hypothetical protein
VVELGLFFLCSATMDDLMEDLPADSSDGREMQISPSTGIKEGN